MDMASLIINLISGAVGGNAAGAAMPDKSLGTVGNSLAGLLGGGVGGAILQTLMAPRGSSGDLGSIIGNIAGGGIFGGMLMIIGSYLKDTFAKA
jgi:uncharacterized membrane protein YeaQ/YmgE (transglycosylase-associated protein family)